MKYIICSNRRLEVLEEEVNSHLQRGGRIIGQPFLSGPNPDNSNDFCQAMYVDSEAYKEDKE